MIGKARLATASMKDFPAQSPEETASFMHGID
jgi:hypothetical protein